MEIIIAENAGFCFGVERALNKTITTIEENKNNQVYSLGPLIHNNQVIEQLNKKGLGIINSIDEIDEGKVIIRSHGVSEDIFLKARDLNIDMLDATCPFVKTIQKKVKEYYNNGYKIIIIGNPNHPEVIGINGWCNRTADIFNSIIDVESIPEYDKICIVAQTTARKDIFDELSNILVNKARKSQVFNTICNATKSRQQACETVAKAVDAMVVIGGFHSSNTQKLVQISKKYCTHTYHIETVDQLPLDKIKGLNKVGITAGASTPDWIIKEVIDKMNSSDNKMNEMMEAIENTMVQIGRGDIVEGTVISVNENEVMVNIGYKSDGIIKKEEFTNDPNTSLNELINIGDTLQVYVVKLNDDEGNVVLSKKRVDDIKGWEELESAYNNEEEIKAKVIQAVKGGVIALVNGIRGFIPASHISTSYVENLDAYLGEEFDVKIIDFDSKRKRVVLSRKAIEKKEEEKKQQQLWSTIEVGKKIEGTVKRITGFGAFVDIGGMDGLIHISELSWGRVKHPSEIVKEGDQVEVIVLDFDKDKGRISLGLKQNKAHPWEAINQKFKAGNIVEGKVVNLTTFGAFVELEPGLEGLVHISEISKEHVSKTSDELKIGQKVQVKILDIKEEEQRISLSIKEAEQEENKSIQEKNQKANEDEDEVTIGDLLKNK